MQFLRTANAICLLGLPLLGACATAPPIIVVVNIHHGPAAGTETTVEESARVETTVNVPVEYEGVETQRPEAPCPLATVKLEPLTPTVSSTYGGWPATNALDANAKTSWFSSSNDSVAHGKTPYFEVALPRAAVVRHVKIDGNRDPSWSVGYSVKAGRIELKDADGRILYQRTALGSGSAYDFDFAIPPDLNGRAKTVRFTSTDDEGDKNPYGDVAIGEMSIEAEVPGVCAG